jgi:hypothetical protein
MSTTPNDILAKIDGEIVAGNNATGTLVGSVMIGAVSYEGALRYMARKEHKAVITGANRPDIALAALATPTACLILTGEHAIDPTVLANARRQGVPILRSKNSTETTLERVQTAFGSTPLRSDEQISLVDELVRQSIDLEPLIATLGLG